MKCDPDESVQLITSDILHEGNLKAHSRHDSCPRPVHQHVAHDTLVTVWCHWHQQHQHLRVESAAEKEKMMMFSSDECRWFTACSIINPQSILRAGLNRVLLTPGLKGVCISVCVRQPVRLCVCVCLDSAHLTFNLIFDWNIFFQRRRLCHHSTEQQNTDFCHYILRLFTKIVTTTASLEKVEVGQVQLMCTKNKQTAEFNSNTSRQWFNNKKWVSHMCPEWTLFTGESIKSLWKRKWIWHVLQHRQLIVSVQDKHADAGKGKTQKSSTFSDLDSEWQQQLIVYIMYVI